MQVAGIALDNWGSTGSTLHVCRIYAQYIRQNVLYVFPGWFLDIYQPYFQVSRFSIACGLCIIVYTCTWYIENTRFSFLRNLKLESKGLTYLSRKLGIQPICYGSV